MRQVAIHQELVTPAPDLQDTDMQASEFFIVQTGSQPLNTTTLAIKAGTLT